MGRVQLMGRVQAEVFQSLVRDRFDVELSLDAGRILYRETIADTVEGVGHFEPLRHYAEVHLLLEPLPRGSGLAFDSCVGEEELDRSWQRLILIHLAERQHPGVLTGSPITDMKITLAAGRAHLRHTEGGDFRQATDRAARRNEAPNPIAAKQKKEYLIVDGYNLIFAWDELKKLAEGRLDLARGRLMDMLSGYCGHTKSELALVFDGFRSPGNPGERGEYHNIHVAYTADGETGDAYIERIVDEIGKNYGVRVITSDKLIRLPALRSGVLRTSSKEFSLEAQWMLEQIGAVLRQSNQGAHKTKLRDGKNGTD